MQPDVRTTYPMPKSTPTDLCTTSAPVAQVLVIDGHAEVGVHSTIRLLLVRSGAGKQNRGVASRKATRLVIRGSVLG